MSEEYVPSEVPLYEDRTARDDAYYRAEREAQPFLAVERYEEGYAVTYDLFPAGYELSKPVVEELNERLTRKVEDLVSDPATRTAEVSKTVGASLGSVSMFAREADAREVAALASRFVLDEANWVEASPPEATDEYRRN